MKHRNRRKHESIQEYLRSCNEIILIKIRCLGAAEKSKVKLKTESSRDELVESVSKKGMENVGPIERLLSMVAGTALIGAGLLRRGKLGTALFAGGGVMIWRGVTGRCFVYKALGMSTAVECEDNEDYQSFPTRGLTIDQSITVHRPVEEVFRFWRDLSNLPRFLSQVQSIQVKDEKHSRWSVRTWFGGSMQWNAEIFKEKHNRLIAWKSEEKARIPNMGTVHFSPLKNGHESSSTEVRITFAYQPPGAALGLALFRLLGDSIAKQIGKDLHVLKDILENVRTSSFSIDSNRYEDA